MSKYKRKNGVASIFYYIFVFMLFVAITGVSSSLIKTSSQNVYIKYDGQRLSNESTLSLVFNEDLVFDVSSISAVPDYTVQIVPCNSFSYTVNGNLARYEKVIEDFPTELYNVTKSSSGFVLRLFDFNILTILHDYHVEGSEIVLPEGFDLFGSYYALEITFDGEEDGYKIPFDLISPVEGVELGGNIVL